jgi:calcineurin-like phosphoesterase family protein
MKIDKEKFETVLLSNWTTFIDPRELLVFVQNCSVSKINKISLSRFEMISKGFLVWVECNQNTSNQTVELFIDNNGAIRLQKVA